MKLDATILIELAKKREQVFGIRMPTELLTRLKKEKAKLSEETGMKLSLASYIILKLAQ